MVIVLSAPVCARMVVVFVPASANTLSFHVNGKSSSQTVESISEVTLGQTVRLTVRMLSQSAEFERNWV